MKLIDQVCSLEQAIQLKKLGVTQESYFVWVGGFEGADITPEVMPRWEASRTVNGYYGDPDRLFAAYTTSELMHMMPVGFAVERMPDNRYICGTRLLALSNYSMAIAVAAMLIHLKGGNL